MCIDCDCLHATTVNELVGLYQKSHGFESIERIDGIRQWLLCQTDREISKSDWTHSCMLCRVSRNARIDAAASRILQLQRLRCPQLECTNLRGSNSYDQGWFYKGCCEDHSRGQPTPTCALDRCNEPCSPVPSKPGAFFTGCCPDHTSKIKTQLRGEN